MGISSVKFGLACCRSCRALINPSCSPTHRLIISHQPKTSDQGDKEARVTWRNLHPSFPHLSRQVKKHIQVQSGRGGHTVQHSGWWPLVSVNLFSRTCGPQRHAPAAGGRAASRLLIGSLSLCTLYIWAHLSGEGYCGILADRMLLLEWGVVCLYYMCVRI